MPEAVPKTEANLLKQPSQDSSTLRLNAEIGRQQMVAMTKPLVDCCIVLSACQNEDIPTSLDGPHANM